MTPAQPKRPKLAGPNNGGEVAGGGSSAGDIKSASVNADSFPGARDEDGSELDSVVQSKSNASDTFGLGDVGDLTDDTDSDDEDEEDEPEADSLKLAEMNANHMDIQEQLAAAGPAGVAAAAAIATARKRKRPHTFETNPSVRKRQQTRLIRKLRACIDEYTMRVGQQAVVLITMPGKAVHNFKVFGAQPLESVIRSCKHEIMVDLEQALLEQAPMQFKEDGDKHELPPLVIDGIPTPVEKMTQAQLRAFIPLMLKYSTGRGKPGWGKESTRPPWWPETLPWANVRSDARDESEKQRISWTTTLRQIVTNCYRYHGRDDLLPTFDESEEASKQGEEGAGKRPSALGQAGSRSLGSSSSSSLRHHHHHHQQHQQAKDQLEGISMNSGQQVAPVYSSGTSAYASNFVHTITNSDGSVSLIHVDPANAQILTLPDGTQVRAVRLQTLPGDSFSGHQIGELHEAAGIELSAIETADPASSQVVGATGSAIGEASLGADGQIIVTGEDGTQSCYPMSSLVSIPASVYQQFTQGGHQLSIISADGTSIPANAISIHSIQDCQPVESQASQDQEQHQDAHKDIKSANTNNSNQNTEHANGNNNSNTTNDQNGT